MRGMGAWTAQIDAGDKKGISDDNKKHVSLPHQSPCTQVSNLKPGCPPCPTRTKRCIWPKTCATHALLFQSRHNVFACPTSPVRTAPLSARRSTSG
jgi:hypothetical protein